MDKKKSRLNRASKTRHVIKSHGAIRLTVHRTPKHIYAQIITQDGGTVLASASTLQKNLTSNLEYTGNIQAAKEVGRIIAERAKLIGVEKVAIDRSGLSFMEELKH